jgi:ubiquinone/menaquinone biosynthesis C-methylase UbiE
MSKDPITIFRKTWGTYQKVISNNFMYHREITAAVAALLKTRPGPLSLLDLGCGDASHISKILKPCQLAEYCGCDLSPYALDVARTSLEPFGIPVAMICRDMLAVLREAPASHFDIVYSSYALHHLNTDEKQTFFTEGRRVLRDTGCIILVDVMRNEGQERPDYLDNYNGTVRTEWDSLTHHERDQVQKHIKNCDFPESPSTLRKLARNAGFKNIRRLEKRTWHEAWCFEA